jgi:hypothetical protein
MHYCPLCLKALKGRFAEISHFNTHASRGELMREPWDPDGYSWRFIQGGEPFTQGIDVTGHEAPDHTNECLERAIGVSTCLTAPNKTR